jgi:hypothetical protein
MNDSNMYCRCRQVCKIFVQAGDVVLSEKSRLLRTVFNLELQRTFDRSATAKSTANFVTRNRPFLNMPIFLAESCGGIRHYVWRSNFL